MAEHLIVVQAVEGSSPFIHPFLHQGPRLLFTKLDGLTSCG